MTDRPNAGGRGRSDAMARLAALLSDIDSDPTSPPPADPVDEARSSTERPVGRGERGPDPTRPDAAAPATPPKPRPRPATRARPEARSAVRRADDAPRPPSAVATPPLTRSPEARSTEARSTEARAPENRPIATGPGGPDEPARPVAPGSRRGLTLRGAAFGVAVVLLVAGIPVLGYAGSQALLRSRAGRVIEGKNDPDETGYRAIVDPTPTALVIQRDEAENPVGLTLLALGTGEEGGTVVLIPVQTQVRQPNELVNRFASAFGFGGTTAGVTAVEDLLAIDFAEVVDVDSTTLAQLTQPVAPLTIENPDDVLGGDGRVFAAGQLSLAAEDVGPYLEGTPDEDELARLVRSEAVWRAWLSALRKVPEGDRVGSGTTTGIGPYLRTLAAGDSEVGTLDVARPSGRDPNQTQVPLVAQPGVGEQILQAVPFPVSPSVGRRKTMQVLNGARGEAIPQSILDKLIRANGQLTTIGNAGSFGRERTQIRYRVANVEDDARFAAATLGVDVQVKRMPAAEAAAEDDDLVIVLGKDVIDGQDGG